ncbi:MAG: hypothetical protein JWP91_1455 [Fibrobacteres bacterium]|nr:hypothetical protein [Fibrobacterota bacterium]
MTLAAFPSAFARAFRSLSRGLSGTLSRGIAKTALTAACLAASSSAAPDLTGPEARAFLGGRTGKIAYLKNQLKQIHFIDFSDSVLIEKKVSDDAYCWSPMISPDGKRIVYESQASIYIRVLEENSKDRFLIYSGIPTNGQSLEPHWWVNPKTGEEYILFCTGNVADVEWPPKSGQTYMQKIVANQPSGPLLTLLPFMMASGRSKNGLWGATSHHSTGMYKLYADKVENAFFGSTNWQDSGGWGACNGSISPSKDPLRQNRMMHLNSSLATAGGENFENHKAIIIRTYADKGVASPLWVMGIPGVHCNNDSSGNLFWDHSEWSTDEDYFTAVGSKVIENWTEADLYMGRINLAGESQIRRVLKGGGLNHYPHLWIKDGVLPAKINLGRSALSFVSLKKDTANPAPDTLAVSNGGDGTLPALTIGVLPSWLKVSVLANGGNAPKLVNRVDRAGLALGEYSATVKVSFGQGADSASYLVKFKYADPVLTSLRASPMNPVLRSGDTVRFQAVALDQTGAPLAPQPAISWEALDALPISAGGLVTGDSSHWSRYAFRASAGAVACTTHVQIARFLVRVDAGAAKDSVPAGWISDAVLDASPDASPAVKGAREAAAAALKVDLRTAADSAPSQVYRTIRRPSGAYAFDSLPNGRYAVRLHFVSAFPPASGAAPAAGLAVKLEGVRLLEDYRLPARPDTSGGNPYGLKGETRELQTTVGDGDGLKIEFEGASGDVAIAGLEVFDIGAIPISLKSPNGGETYHVGDTLHVRWDTDGFISSVGIQISPDSGKKWIPVTRRSAINQGQAGWGDYGWAIPDSLDGYSLATDKCLLSVYDYFGSDRDRSDRAFTITDIGTGLRRALPAAGLPDARFEGGRLAISLPRPGHYRASLIDLRGRIAASVEGRGPGALSLPLSGLNRGVYRLAITGEGLQVVRRITMMD